MTIDQLPGKTFAANRNFFAEFDLTYQTETIFGLRYLPNLRVEEQGGIAYAGVWNSQKWQVHHFRKFFSESYVVMRDGTQVLETSAHNWQFSPRQIRLHLPGACAEVGQHFFSNRIEDGEGKNIIATTQNWSVLSSSRLFTVSADANPEQAQALLIYCLYAMLVVED